MQMQPADWIGFFGVALILLAYFLNLTGRLRPSELTYILLNLIGAGLACLASVLVHYLPFVFLEGVWVIVSFHSLIKFFRTSDDHRRDQPTPPASADGS
ncbi:MAG: hypothetical protein KDC54_08785 [Lewinella sp.]|nr:hypothetical protein [Lewinella sp.]